MRSNWHDRQAAPYYTGVVALRHSLSYRILCSQSSVTVAGVCLIGLDFIVSDTVATCVVLNTKPVYCI